MKKYLTAFLLILTLVSSALWAEEAKTVSSTVTLDASDTEITSLLQQISEKTGVKILADNTVSGKLSISVEKKSVDEALNAICIAKKLSWKKIYLGKGTVLQGDNVSQLMRTLDALQATGIVVINPSEKKGTAFQKNAAITPEYEKGLAANTEQYQLVYLVYNPSVALVSKSEQTDSNVDWKLGDPMNTKQFAAVSQQSTEALMNMSPDDQRVAMETALSQQMNMMSSNPQLFQSYMNEGIRLQYNIMAQHPEYLSQMMQAGMKAQIDFQKSLTPEQRQQMMQGMMDAMKSIPMDQMQELSGLMSGAAGQ